ncbi:hypothetical protein ACFSO7_16010 [Bacillus sp. CGMCC 1.16607]|uniref:hypothetical protein n=1 Tax=Bacillus sp. CGMCC 1.16607 TaxID=3351842 RepID=UPI00362CF882
MEKKEKNKDFYESLKVNWSVQERNINSMIQEILDNKEFIKHVSNQHKLLGNHSKKMNESIETLSMMFNFPTKRDMANIAKMQVQLEEKLDRIEDLLSLEKNKKNLAQNDKVKQTQSNPNSERRERLRQILMETLENNGPFIKGNKVI